jgi:SAM-dependent methyltransferase
MNIIDEIDNKIINLHALQRLIESYNYDNSSKFILNELGKMELPLKNRLLYMYEKIYIPLKLDKTKNKKILDLGSGFCHNNLICKALKHICHNIERPPKEEIYGHVSNLYRYFHKILKLKNVEYCEITSPVINLKNNNKYDYIFILNNSFDEIEVNKQLRIWGIDEWKVFIKCLHRNLKPNGKIIISWSKGKISDKNNHKDWSKYNNCNIVKYLHNKNIDFFNKNKEYRVITLT